MPRYSAWQIYGFARSAGFSPDQSATMTAIALAESGGVSTAHNSSGEDSRGLWQINAHAHPDLAGRFDLYDPVQNAEAAWAVSGHGRDVEAWTTTHGGVHASYLRYRAQAEQAAIAHGDGPDRGNWSGTSGYGDPLSAGSAGAGLGSGVADPGDLGPGESGLGTGGGAASPADTSSSATFLREALAQRGDRYIFGAEASPSDPDPHAFDCSELTQWASARAGITIPDGASNQYLWAKEHGYLVPVSQAREVPGALLFEFSTEPRPGGGRPSEAHVAISLGQDKTIEARGTAYGVNEFSSDNRGFNYAAVIPGLASPGADVDALLSGTGATAGDADGDGVPDEVELRLGLDPYSFDTDHDGLGDAYELEVSHTDPRLADSDHDKMTDAYEIAHGTDPMQPDPTAGGALDGAVTGALASDPSLDTDPGFEASLSSAGSDPQLLDHDLDGYSDALEIHAGSDPFSAMSTPLHPEAGDHDLHGDDPHDALHDDAMFDGH